MNFDVMRGPWIDCHDVRGKTEKLGIRDLLLRAHELEGVHDISPLQEYGIYRLLTVVVMDICCLRTSADMEALLEEGCFDKSQIDDYIARCEKDGPCFNLFDARKPFMQDAFNPEYDEEKCIKPVSTLLHDLPGGNNHIHFDHRLEDVHRLTYAECAKALCAVNVFCTAGLQGPSSINGAPPYYALIKGENLYRTLILNCVYELAGKAIPYAEPGPVWRNSSSCVPGKEIASVSLLEGMTLRARRICLIDDDGGLVSRMYFQKGLNFIGYSAWRDPHTILSQKETSIKPSMDKDLWRNIATLLSATKNAPLTIAQLSKSLDYAEYLSITVYGLVTRQAALDTWLRDTLSAPTCIVQTPWRMDELGGYIDTAESGGYLLRKAMLRITAETKIEMAGFLQQTAQRYYANVRNHLFGKQLNDLAHATIEQMESLRVQWLGMVRSAAREAFAWGSEHMGDSARMLKAVAQAERSLYMSLGALSKEKVKEEA